MAYCYCNTEDDRDDMIQCDEAEGCSTWYHFGCLNLFPKFADATDKYFCPSCSRAGKGESTYKHLNGNNQSQETNKGDATFLRDRIPEIEDGERRRKAVVYRFAAETTDFSGVSDKAAASRKGGKKRKFDHSRVQPAKRVRKRVAFTTPDREASSIALSGEVATGLPTPRDNPLRSVISSSELEEVMQSRFMGSMEYNEIPGFYQSDGDEEPGKGNRTPVLTWPDGRMGRAGLSRGNGFK